MPLSALFSPTFIRGKKLKNHWVMAPLVTGMEREANIGDLKDFYVKRARGGASMIIISEAIVHQSGKRFAYERPFDATLDVPRYRVIAKALRQENCASILQLVHMGPSAPGPINWAAQNSTLNSKKSWRTPSFLLNRFIQAYGKTTALAVQAQFDGVEISGNGHSLIANFLSPISNQRNDPWGRSQLTRFKLALDIVREVRKQLGDDKILGVRFNLAELAPSGADWTEIKRFVQMLRMEGVDYLACDFVRANPPFPTQGYITCPGALEPFYEALTQVTPLPVLFGQELASSEHLNTIAKRLPHCLFELARPLIADPEYLNKLEQQKTDTICHCLRCGIGCVKSSPAPHKPISCLVNPFLFIPKDRVLRLSSHPKTLAVIGAGISGIQFSILAAQRGHEVHLFEKNDHVGGQIQMMTRIPGLTSFSSWLNRLEIQLREVGVHIHTNHTATLQDLISERQFDEFVLAAGTRPLIPDIEGIDSSNVLTYQELLEENLPVGNRVAVLGINYRSLAVARFLTDGEGETSSELSPESWRNAWGIGDLSKHRGGVLGFIPEVPPPLRRVYLFENSPEQTARLLNTPNGQFDWQWLLLRGVQNCSDVSCDIINNVSVGISFGPKHSNPQTIRLDHVVICCGEVPNNALAPQLESAGFTVHRLGACRDDLHDDTLPSLIEQATQLALTI